MRRPPANSWLDLDEQHLFKDDRLFAAAALLVEDGSLSEAALSDLCLFTTASCSASPTAASAAFNQSTSWFSSLLQRLPKLADQRAVFVRELSLVGVRSRAAAAATAALAVTHTLTLVHHHGCLLRSAPSAFSARADLSPHSRCDDDGAARQLACCSTLAPRNGHISRCGNCQGFQPVCCLSSTARRCVCTHVRLAARGYP